MAQHHDDQMLAVEVRAADLAAREARLDALNRTIRELEDRSAFLQREHDRPVLALESRLEALQAENAMLQASVTALEGECVAAQRALEQSRLQIDEVRKGATMIFARPPRIAMSTSNASPPFTSAPTVSVVICTYTDRRWDVMAEAITASLAQRPRPFEVIVVLDHNPALGERVRRAFPDVVTVPNAGERGLSGARNSGIARASGDVIAFLDDDAIPGDGWLAALTAAYADPHVVGTGGIALPMWDDDRPAWLPEEFLWTVGCSYRGLPSFRRPIRNPIGATMAFRRSVFGVVGGFTDGIGRVGKTPLGCEETEFSIRALAAMPARTIIHVPEATVTHLVPQERARWSYFLRRCWAEGLSKAIVSASVGNHDGLASERTYATRVLPLGVLRGCSDLLRGDAGGALRAFAIIAGMATTTAGFVCGVAARRLASR